MAFVFSDFVSAAIDYVATHPAQAVLFNVALLFIAWKMWRLARVRVLRSRADRLVSVRSLHAIAMAQQDVRDRRVFQLVKGRHVSINRS